MNLDPVLGTAFTGIYIVVLSMAENGLPNPVNIGTPPRCVRLPSLVLSSTLPREQHAAGSTNAFTGSGFAGEIVAVLSLLVALPSFDVGEHFSGW